MRDGWTCENLILAGALLSAPAAGHLIQSTVDQAVHQGTGGDFEIVSTWGKEKKKKKNHYLEQEESRPSVLIRNPVEIPATTPSRLM